MKKYNGIKTVTIVGEQELIAAERYYASGQTQTEREYADISQLDFDEQRPPRIFLWQFLICAFFVGAYFLCGLLPFEPVQTALSYIKTAINYDLLGTDSAGCIINIWLSGIL